VVYITHWSFRKHLDRTQELVDSQERLSKLYQATTRSLALAIDAKDRYTHQHILRVQRYALAVAGAMGISGDELHAIEVGALLHDIGKLGIPEEVLLKPGRLTNEEFELIKQHPRMGAEILEPVPFPWPVLPVVKYHHERWDGTGYPERLRGEEIPRSARILAVADVYDALTTDRSYRGAWSHARACEEIRLQSGKHFDPVVVEKFLAVIDSVVEENPLPELVALPQRPAEEERAPVSLPVRPLSVATRSEETLIPVGVK
jgi:putative nucleotidyltransferase with HDIG domain